MIIVITGLLLVGVGMTLFYVFRFAVAPLMRNTHDSEKLLKNPDIYLRDAYLKGWFEHFNYPRFDVDRSEVVKVKIPTYRYPLPVPVLEVGTVVDKPDVQIHQPVAENQPVGGPVNLPEAIEPENEEPAQINPDLEYGIDYLKASKNTWIFRIRPTCRSHPPIVIKRVYDKVFKLITKKETYGKFKASQIEAYKARAIRSNQKH
jgi:hypothetical protein